MFLCDSFRLITSVHVLVSSYVMVDKPQKVFVGAYGGHSFWTRVVKLLKVAAFSHLVLKSNNFEKIKYAQKKEILRNVQYKKTLADPLHRFQNFAQ